MFRLNPSSLIQLYSVVPYPHASVFGSFIVSLLPLGTDYSAYIESKLKGLDFAFYSFGYGYHTLLDNLESISIGGIQHLGENQLSIIDNIQKNVDLNEEFDESSWIFFDFIGKILIYYTSETSRMVEFFLILCGILVLFGNFFMLYYETNLYREKKMTKETPIQKIFDSFGYILIYFFGYLFSVFNGIFLSLFFGLFVNVILFYLNDEIINPFAWYRSIVFSWFLFGFPAITGMILGQWLINAAVGNWCCQRLRAHRPKIKYNGNLAKFHSLQKERYLAMTLLWTISLMMLSFFRASYVYIFIWYSFVQITFTCLFFVIDAAFRVFVAKGAIYEPIQTDPSDKDITKSSGAKTKSYMYLLTENKIYWMLLPILTLIPCIISMDFFFRASATCIGILSKIGGFSDLAMAFSIGVSTCFLFLSYLPSLILIFHTFKCCIQVQILERFRFHLGLSPC
jgi:hypothetical protein